MISNIENKNNNREGISVNMSDINIDISNENNASMKAKFESLLWRVTNIIEKRKDVFIAEISEYKDRLWFWRDVWRCMMEVEYFIEWNSRNKALCIAFIDHDLNLENIDFSNPEPILAS